MKLKILLSCILIIFFSGCVGTIVSLPVKAAGTALSVTGDVVDIVVP
jgi:hypothetical protein